MKKAKYCNKICEFDFKVNNMGTLLFLQAVIVPEIIGIFDKYKKDLIELEESEVNEHE